VASKIGTPRAPDRRAGGWFAMGLGVTAVFASCAATGHIAWKAFPAQPGESERINPGPWTASLALLDYATEVFMRAWC
jgi:hypothetical protein